MQGHVVGHGRPNWEAELGGHVGGHGRPCSLRPSERLSESLCGRPHWEAMGVRIGRPNWEGMWEAVWEAMGVCGGRAP